MERFVLERDDYPVQPAIPPFNSFGKQHHSRVPGGSNRAAEGRRCGFACEKSGGDRVSTPRVFTQTQRIAKHFLGLDPTPCHTGWALYDRADGSFTYGVIEPPKEVTEDLPRMEYILENVFELLPPTSATWKDTVFVVIEGLAFNGRGSYALQLAGLGYMLRRHLWKLGVPFKDVPPTSAKKFLTGKGNCDKNLILKEVFKRYQVDVDDDNIADAVNFNMIGRALLGWTATTNQAQQAVIEALRTPKVKSKKKPKVA